MKHYLIPLLALTIACNGDKETDSAESAFAPTEGSWSPDDSAYTDDGCNLTGNPVFSTAAVDAVVFSLSLTSATAGTVTVADMDPIDCTLDDMIMTCTTSLTNDVATYNDAEGNPVVDENGEEVDPDAVLTTGAVFTVTFTDSETGTYTSTVDVSCEGADCAGVQESNGVSAYPCSSTVAGDFVME